MMIFQSTLLHIEKFLSYFVVHQAGKRIREMFSIYIPAYSNVLVAETPNMVADLLRRFRLSKLRQEIYPHIFRPTSFPLPMDRFSWKLIFSTKEFDRRSTSDLRSLVSVL